VESVPKSEVEIQNRGLERKLPKAKKDFLGTKIESLRQYISIGQVNISHYWLGCSCLNTITP